MHVEGQTTSKLVVVVVVVMVACVQASKQKSENQDSKFPTKQNQQSPSQKKRDKNTFPSSEDKSPQRHRERVGLEVCE